MAAFATDSRTRGVDAAPHALHARARRGDAARRPGGAVESALDAIAAQPRPANGASPGPRSAADAFIDRLAAHRPELALTFCLDGATSLESLAARQRIARMLLAHGSDEQLLAFARTQAARPSPRAVTLEVESDDVGSRPITHAHGAARYARLRRLRCWASGQEGRQGRRPGRPPREACVMVRMKRGAHQLARRDAAQRPRRHRGADPQDGAALHALVRLAGAALRLHGGAAFGAYQVESSVAESRAFDNAVRTSMPNCTAIVGPRCRTWCGCTRCSPSPTATATRRSAPWPPRT